MPKFLNRNKGETSKTSLSPSLGKGMVRPYLGGRTDSGNIYRHTVGTWEYWVSLGNNQLPYNCEGRRK